MALEVKEKRIGAHLYRVTQLPAKKGRALLVRLTKLLGPGLAAAFGDLGRDKASTAEAAIASGIGQGLYELAERLSESEVGSILDELAVFTTVVLDAEREPRLSDVFDDHFAGRYDEMLLWAGFCLEVNYASFFDGSGGSGGLLRRALTLLQASTSPSTSKTAGTSTGSRPAGDTPTG